ncbi:MAG: hypothetical protein JXA96_00705 [Sedimentisphaerales bacterium]|nr:hypothetical protein [Sedimentisphaerales bacterium]
MKSKITKIASVVMIIGLVAIGATLINQTSTPAYAVEQTIEAMRNIKTAHCFGTTFDGDNVEMWIEVNPQTGANEKLYFDSSMVSRIATQDEVYTYQKNSNIVIHVKKSGLISNEIRFGRFIEDMVASTTKNNDAKINITEINGEKPFILLTLETDEMLTESKVDAVTKLPMSINVKSTKNPQQGEGKSIDQIFYNEPLPEGIFDFVIPEGARVIEQ